MNYTFGTASSSPSDLQSASTRDQCLGATLQLVFPGDALNISSSFPRPDTSNYACRGIPVPPFCTARPDTFASAETSCPCKSRSCSWCDRRVWHKIVTLDRNFMTLHKFTSFMNFATNVLLCDPGNGATITEYFSDV